MPIILILIVVGVILIIKKRPANAPTDAVIAKQAEVIDSLNDVVQAEKNPIPYSPLDILDNPKEREFFTTSPELAEISLGREGKQFNKVVIDESQNRYKYVFIATNNEYASIYEYFEFLSTPV